MSRVEQLLRSTMGLDAASIGSSLIERTVRLRMKTLGIKRAEAYCQLLKDSPHEWNELIESVVVTETWFFRDREPFSALIRMLNEEWLPAAGSRTMRLLSVPCSSGEEPYSLVMALLNAGLSPQRFQVDAVDISARVLARAQLGIYGKNSFRGKDLAFRDKYFKATREGFVLNEEVRNLVWFCQCNLLSDDVLQGRGPYDFIFCRNLLIYFDRPTQQRALERIQRLLTPAGVLFVGAAEQPWVLEHGFTPANFPMAFACRRVNGAQVPRPKAPPRPPPRILHPPLPATQTPWSPRPQRMVESRAAAAKPVAKPPKVIPPDLEMARRLADAGQLEEASAICQTHLRESGASAQAYYLLGLVRDAVGDPSAIEYYRKALYLEPNHYESLLQMALLSQRNGDSTRARAFKNRAQRIKLKT